MSEHNSEVPKQPESKTKVGIEPAASTVPTTGTQEESAPAPAEIGGRKGPEPTRYGDWEKNGRCIDF